jgi:hypothetical protein
VLEARHDRVYLSRSTTLAILGPEPESVRL